MSRPASLARATSLAEYQSTYRRSEVAIPCLLAIVVLFVAGMIGSLRFIDSGHFESMILGLGAVTGLSLVATLLSSLRVHRWTIRPQGVDILQRPRVPLTGLSRRTTVAFADIAALRNVESGLEHLIEIVTRDGRRFRLSQALTKDPRGLGRPDPAADLNDFARSIRTAAEKAGSAPLAVSEGLSFWNSIPGLAVLVTLFALTLLIAGLTAWALWDGLTLGPRPRGGEAIAIFLLLPIGAGYLLRRSCKRRAAVLASLRRE